MTTPDIADPAEGGSADQTTGLDTGAGQNTRTAEKWFRAVTLLIIVGLIVWFVIYTVTSDGATTLNAVFAAGLVVMGSMLLGWSYVRRPAEGQADDFLDKLLAGAGQALLLGAVLTFGFGLVGQQLDDERGARDRQRDEAQTAERASQNYALSVRDAAGGKDYRGLDLSEQNLSGLDMREFNFTSADLTGADLSAAYLSDAILYEAKLIDADLWFASLCAADLSDADLDGVDLGLANLTGANLVGADLSGLKGFELNGANLTEAFLGDADLSGADLSGANLTGAYLSGANLTGANLTAANLTAANLTETKLTDVSYTDDTKWPADFDRPTSARLIEAEPPERDQYFDDHPATCAPPP